MRRASWIALASLLCGASLAADFVRLKPLASVYVDAKGGGLRLPQGVAVGGDLAAVADAGNGRVVTYTASADGLRPRAELASSEVPFPIAVAVLSTGEILALDGKSRRIARLAKDGTFAGWLSTDGAEGAVGIRSLSAGPGDEVYLLDVAGGRILAVDAGGKLQGSIAVPPEVGFLSDLTVDGKGDVYAVDSVGRRIWAARKGETALAPLTPALPAEFEFPTSIAADDQGRLFVGDQNGGGIVVFGRDGTFRGRQLAMGWKEGFLRYPADLCVGPGGTLLVAERGNNRVQVFGTR